MRGRASEYKRKEENDEQDIFGCVSFAFEPRYAYFSYAESIMGKGGFMTFNSLDLVGVPVKNPRGRFPGLVDGVMIDSQGQAFAIVNHGGLRFISSGKGNYSRTHRRPIGLREKVR